MLLHLVGNFKWLFPIPCLGSLSNVDSEYTLTGDQSVYFLLELSAQYLCHSHIYLSPYWRGRVMQRWKGRYCVMSCVPQKHIFKDLSYSHIKRGIGEQSRADPSFGTTPTAVGLCPPILLSVFWYDNVKLLKRHVFCSMWLL